MKNNVDILFVNPPLSLEERYGHLSPGGSLMPPIGLCSLAAVTRKEGFKTKILDAPAMCFTMEETVSEILKVKPKYLGLTAATVSVNSAGDIASIVKSANSDIRIIIGGPHFIAAPEKTMEMFEDFEIGVLGEGEITVIELLKALESGSDSIELSKIKGLIYRENDKLCITPAREYIEDLDTLPKPAWDLLPELKKHYRPSILRGYHLPAAGIVTSRGCTGKCTFCDRAMFGSRLRANSAEYVVEMMEELHTKYGIKEVFIFDDNIMLFKKRLKEICSILMEKRLKMKWSCFARIDFAKPKVLKMMKKAGCRLVAYGIENGDQEMLDFLKKNIKLEKVKQVIQWTKEAGLMAEGLFMMGLPRETRETMQATIDFAKSNLLDDIAITVFTPLPGTKLYKDIRQYGRFEENWKKMSQHYPVFVPYGLSREEIMEYNNRGLREFYLRYRKLPNLLRRIKSIRHLFEFVSAGIIFVSRTIGSEKSEKGCV